ncbi:ATP-binding protein [Bacillus solimangrovi]|uniref:histidine kinase n=1 Tax=Bacillus solimangrovi TaxID=1305675 RepID=A0A1E5LDD4_9BACI|nr:sensor histidine kinase [Bacillus solimangrovi]OEH92107.1 histidine kinase [Bacillus solimangrovi]
MKQISIKWKVLLFIFTIILFSLLIVGIVLIGNFINMKERELSQQALITARTVAQLSSIQENMYGTNEQRGKINWTVERIRIINNADYIVVMDMNRTRLSHPVDKLIGAPSNGNDETPAFAEHTYTSKAKGEVGTAVRGFVPIMNNEHQQVGVVMVGYILPKLSELFSELQKEIYLTVVITFLFGGWGAWMLARMIKEEMFQLEPYEIAKLLVERTETFNAMHEGVVAIDNNKKITIFNHRAKEMLSVSENPEGKQIQDVLPDTRLPEILKLNTPIYNKELKISNKNILSNRIPIKVNKLTVGAVAIFQDQTEVKKIAEELTGVKAFVNALRVQNHEHMNKLHTIAGLIQMGNTQQALDYVFQITEEQQELTHFLSNNIYDDNISGLLLGKVRRGKELGINVQIDRQSQLKQFPPPLDHHDFVLILGNLIENAFDSFNHFHIHDKEIYISIEQDEEILSILIEDNGCGMSMDVQDHIFEHGFSTKDLNTNQGIGLFLVKQIIEKGRGNILIESYKDEGTTFTITFFMNKGENENE